MTGAQCGNPARWDLCGGPSARAVPTATISDGQAGQVDCQRSPVIHRDQVAARLIMRAMPAAWPTGSAGSPSRASTLIQIGNARARCMRGRTGSGDRSRSCDAQERDTSPSPALLGDLVEILWRSWKASAGQAHSGDREGEVLLPPGSAPSRDSEELQLFTRTLLCRKWVSWGQTTLIRPIDHDTPRDSNPRYRTLTWAVKGCRRKSK